jgi:spore coat polysaccharide biosynthesis protein SpsF
MEAGQRSNIKVGFIIQARMRSTRLPGKVLLPLPLNGGKPIIQWIVDAVTKSRYDHEVILATSINQENDPLFEYCQAHDIKCYRGDEENVLSRFIEIIDTNEFDVVIRLTGDNPLVDINIVDQAIDFHLRSKNDYTITQGLPIGMNCEVVNASVLQSLKNRNLTGADREHVTLFIRNSGFYKTQVLIENFDPKIKEARLTVDYPSDFLVMNAILSLALESNRTPMQVVTFVIENYPWILTTNSTNFQRRNYVTFLEEKNAAIDLLTQLEMKRVVDKLNEVVE